MAQRRSVLEPKPKVILADDPSPETLARLVPGVHGIAVRIARLPLSVLAAAEDLQVVSHPV